MLQGVDATSLDPAYAIATTELNIFWHVFDSLLDRDVNTLQLVPGLARTWKNVDETTWEFSLQRGVKFHNGEPLNAQAVQFTLDRLKNNTPKPNHLFATQAAYDRTVVVDDSTFQVKTTKPIPILADLLVNMFVLPPKYYADTPADQVQRAPVGSGPYVFKEWVKDDHITMEANPNYWQKPATIQQVTFKPVPELSTRVAQLQSGDADLIVNLGPEQVQLLDSSTTARSVQVEGGRVVYIGIRVDKPPFDDKRVRQALNYAVDFDTINQQLLGGVGQRATSIVNPPHVSPNSHAYTFDPEKAKSLLRDAGVDTSVSVVIDAPDGRYLKDKELAQAVAQNLTAIGIKSTVTVQDWNVYLNDMIIKRNTDPLYLLGLGAYNSGQEELYRVHKDNAVEATHWDNAQYLQLYDQLNATFDSAKRQDIMNQMQAIVWDEAPWIFLWYQTNLYGVSRRLQWQARGDERINMYTASLSA